MKSVVAKAAKNSPLYWRYVSNAKGSLNQRLHPASLNDVQKRVLQDLKRDGIVLTSVNELLGADSALFKELSDAVDVLEKEQASQIEEYRANVDAPGFKSYMLELLGKEPVVTRDSIFARFALEPTFQDIVNEYFEMETVLGFFNVWHNFATQKEARNSQLWHRDPEDRCIIKMFVYLSDVDEGAGALTYAPGTHEYGTVEGEPETFSEEDSTARRTDDPRMAAFIPENKWVKAIGPKGTIAFVDTRGYHKGGHVKDRERLLYNCRYVSHGAWRGRTFKFADQPSAPSSGN